MSLGHPTWAPEVTVGRPGVRTKGEMSRVPPNMACVGSVDWPVSSCGQWRASNCRILPGSCPRVPTLPVTARETEVRDQSGAGETEKTLPQKGCSHVGSHDPPINNLGASSPGGGPGGLWTARLRPAEGEDGLCLWPAGRDGTGIQFRDGATHCRNPEPCSTQEQL